MGNQKRAYPRKDDRCVMIAEAARALIVKNDDAAFVPRGPKALSMFWPVLDELKRGFLASPNRKSM